MLNIPADLLWMIYEVLFSIRVFHEFIGKMVKISTDLIVTEKNLLLAVSKNLAVWLLWVKMR